MAFQKSQKAWNRKDLTSLRFGRLVAIRDVGINKDKKRLWECKCDCGGVIVTSSKRLNNGTTQSCGCLRTEVAIKIHRKHGFAFTSDPNKKKMYTVFMNINARCTKPSAISYKNYGGRGITVEWKSFESFAADMYPSFLKHVEQYGSWDTTIERTNNDGPYSKKNCRWATREEQRQNIRYNPIKRRVGAKRGWMTRRLFDKQIKIVKNAGISHVKS